MAATAADSSTLVIHNATVVDGTDPRATGRGRYGRPGRRA